MKRKQFPTNHAISAVLLPSIYEDIGLDGNNDGDIKGGQIPGKDYDIFLSLGPLQVRQDYRMREASFWKLLDTIEPKIPLP